MSKLNKIVPKYKIALVEKTLEVAFNSKKIVDIELISGGLSNSLVYKLTIDDGVYVLKLSTKDDLLKDPKRYLICNKYASDKGIAPYLYYSNPDEGLSISYFIDSKKNEIDFFTSYNALLTSLSTVVKSIQSLPLFPKLINFLDGIDIFIENYKKSKLFSDKETKEHFDLYSKIQEFYPRNDADLVSSHNDLNRNNILFDGRKIWIVDWDASFQNDRYVDLATIGNLYIKTIEHEEIFLSSYFSRMPTEYEKSRFFLMQQIINFYYSMIMLNMLASNSNTNEVLDFSLKNVDKLDFYKKLSLGEISMNENKSKLTYAKILLQNTLANMKNERFEYAINKVKNRLR